MIKIRDEKADIGDSEVENHYCSQTSCDSPHKTHHILGVEFVPI
jgi:hypothetical protein